MSDLRRILIVDDTPEDHQVYRRLLRSDRERRYEFLDAELGMAGLELCESERPDCVLLDYSMPDIDGLEFLTRLNGNRQAPHTAVVVLTGQGNESVAVRAMKAGAQDYLLKGAFDGSTLARAIDNAIEKVQLLQRIERRTEELGRANEELQREVVQRRRAEEALQRLTNDLERLVEARTAELSRANRLKDEFLATVSHELRTPLNAILGWAQVLLRSPESPEMKARALETIERNARWQMRLIDDILDVSRIGSGKLHLDLQPFDLANLVESALDVVRPSAAAKGLRLEADIAGPAPILGDPDRLRQVVWNILSNAVKFTPAGTVSIRLIVHPDTCEIIVSDTGVGIAPEFLPHVFEPFRQADASTTRRHGGLGLGLAIGRQLVEHHGGTITAESEGEGKGAAFTVRLPRRLPAATPAPAADSGRPRLRSRRLDGVRVLVVDDDADARELLAAILGQHGAVVIARASGPEALAHLTSDRPQVILSDIAMPNMSGYEFLARVRALDDAWLSAVPAVAITAHAREIDKGEALSAGYQTHVAKPFDPNTLTDVVERLVRADRVIG